MIKSILDTDLYKFSMSYAYFTLYPLAEGTFSFTDRNKEDWSNEPEFIKELTDAFNNLANLALTDTEKEYCIKNISYIPQIYWEWLSTFRFEPSKLHYGLDKNGVFYCDVTDTMMKVTLYEIAVLATYSEVRNHYLDRKNGNKYNLEVAMSRLEDKIGLANISSIQFSDFGTRRRYDEETHEACIKLIKEKSETCKCTSNVYYAMKYNMIPTGTMAHEWIMFHASNFGYKRANYLAMEDWIKVYQGNLGTALIDTYTTDSFLRTLTRQQALLLTGFRQDSGDERTVGNKIIDRLKEFGIDPRTKVIVFSNALDILKAIKIQNYFLNRCKVAFGIGTNITCDTGVEGYKPANIVMKLSKCRLSNKDPWEKSLKISDDIGKHTGDDYEYEIAKYELHLN